MRTIYIQLMLLSANSKNSSPTNENPFIDYLP